MESMKVPGAPLKKIKFRRLLRREIGEEEHDWFSFLNSMKGQF